MRCLYCKENIYNNDKIHGQTGDLTGQGVYHKQCYYKEMEETLSKFNIKLYDDNGDFRNFTDIIIDLCEVWNREIINYSKRRILSEIYV